jgi:mannosyltransferase
MIAKGFQRVWGWTAERPLLAILVGGLFVRLVNIHSRPLQYDDLFSFFLSRRSLSEIVPGTAADTMPPLYYFLLHFWQMVSQEVWFLRLLGVIFSLVAVALLYGLALQLFDRQTALWAALIAAISPFQYYHAQDIRNYSLLLACQLGFALCAARLWLRDVGRLSTGQARWDWLGLVLCGAASLYTHNIAVLALGMPNLFLLIQRRWRLFGKLVLAQLAILLLNLPWLVLLPEQFAKVQRAWSLWRPGLADVIQAGLMVTTGLPFTGVWLAIAAVLTIETLALVVLILARRSAEEGKKGRVMYLVCFALGLPAVIFALSYVVRPIFVPRGFIVASMAYYALAGAAIVKGWQNGAGKLVLAGFILSALIGLPNQFAYDGFPRSPVDKVSVWIEARIQPGEGVVHDNKLSYFPARYYAPQLPQVFVADPAGTPNDTFAPGSQQAMQIFPAPDLASAVSGYSGVFFVVYSRTIEEYRAMGLADHPGLAWMKEHFELQEQALFRDVEVYHFTAP